MLMRFKKFLLSTSRRNKKLIVITTDFFSSCAAAFLSLLISDMLFSLGIIENLIRLLWFSTISITSFWLFGVYNSVLRYIDFSLIFTITKATLFIFILNFLLIFSANYFFSFWPIIFVPPSKYEGWLLGIMAFSYFVISSRLIAYYYLSDQTFEKKVVIYGAGAAGIQLASALRVIKEMHPVAFIDKNKTLQGTYLGGIKVLHPEELERLVLREKIDEVLIAMPSIPKLTLKNLLKEIEKFSVKVRILPGLSELAQGKIIVSELKEVDVSDLLGRHEVEASQSLIDKNIKDKVVLITGAGGSIGAEISRQVSNNKPKKIILLDANEYALYSIKKEIEDLKIDFELYAILASVNNRKRILEVCKTFKVNTIYHAAAYKHVPLVEQNPFEAVFNNIRGTKICALAALEAEVDTFVLISTDKAVRPTNIMGATKRFSELILQALAKNSPTRMIMVRFGNVIGSSGSAIPLFQQQIKDGGPVTVTHPEVVRYFMSIPEAAELVIQAGAMGKGGDVFVLDMGEPVKIYDLAKRLIKLSGMEIKDKENPQGEIEIIFTGLRQGEKLFEELLIGDNVSTTEHEQILRAEEDFLTFEELEKYYELLKDAEMKGDVKALINILKKVVNGYTPENEIADVVYQKKNS